MKRVKSMLGRLGREAALWPGILRIAARGGGKKMVVLPCGLEGSSLLRAYNISKALRPLGWQTVTVPKHLSLSQRNRILKAVQPDLVLLQKTRHPLNRMEYLSDWPVVLDLDDADFLDVAEKPYLEEARERALGVICGSRFIENWARAGAQRETKIVWTANVIGAGPWPDHATRKPIVTWAQSDPFAYKTCWDMVVQVCLDAAAQGARFTLRLYNWKGGDKHPDLERLRAVGVALELMPMMPYDAFMRSLRDVAIGLSPVAIEHAGDFNQGKSFGKILGYLDAKVPVICSDEVDHALFFTSEAGVVSNDLKEWSRSIVELLASPEKRTNMSEAAFALYESQMSLDVAARSVDDFLRDVMAKADRSPEATRAMG